MDYLPRFILKNVGGQGANIVSIGYCGGHCSNRSAENRVKLQLCLLVSTLDRHGVVMSPSLSPVSLTIVIFLLGPEYQNLLFL